MGDLVSCCNCGFVGEVPTAQDLCPKCDKMGYLKWTDENKQEAN